MSHGVPRSAGQQDKSAAARAKELQEIEEYKTLNDLISRKVAVGDFSPELLQQTANLLKKNPEYYTIWNHRRRIYRNEFTELAKAVEQGTLDEASRTSQVLDIIQLDLQFLFPLLVKFPKCYWIWNHRLWLLDQSSVLLSASTARRLWQEELGLVSKMLSRDSRNFHGWGYRRKVVQNLESPALGGESMAREEFDYTTKMISMNLSNFSAWHNRTKLILRLLDEQSADDEARQKMLDDELKLIHKALFDPFDQSLWFYHQNLMRAFDPALSSISITPHLTKEQRLNYLAAECDFVLEVLEDARDCKWVYQSLIDLALLEAKNAGQLAPNAEADIHTWLAELKKLDPLRSGRWSDVESSLPSF